MSDEIRVACPHCGSKFRLKNRQSLGRKMTCKQCGDEFTARSVAADAEEVDDEFSGAATLPPVSARRPSGNVRRKKGNRLQLNRWMIIGIGCMVLIGLGIAFSGPLGGLFGKVKQMSDAVNPLADSPQKLANDLMAFRRTSNDIVKSVHDDASRDAAIGKFKELTATTDEFVLRASRLEPLTDPEFRALVEPITKEVMNDLVAETVERTNQKSKTPSATPTPTPEFRAALAELQLAYHLASRSLMRGLKQLPDPKDDLERIECDAAKKYRAIVRQLAHASSAGAMDGAAAEIAGAAAVIQDLAKRAREVAPEKFDAKGGRDFRDAANQAVRQCGMIIGHLEKRFGKHAGLAQAMSELTGSEIALDTALHEMRSAARLQAARNQSVQPSIPGLPGEFPGQQVTGLPGQPAGSPPGFGKLPQSPEAFRENFMKRHGEKGILTVKVREIPLEEQIELMRQVREVSGAMESFAAVETGQTLVFVSYAGDVEEVAGRIEFAKVTNVDAKSRTITIELDDS